MPLALFLVAVGTLCRLAPHPSNAVPMGAICLFAAARLPRWWALGVPLVAMLVSDIILGAQIGVIPGLTAVLATSYGTYALIVFLGSWLRRDAGPATRVGSSLAASTLFFVTTNFAVWASGACGDRYAMTGSGLLECYAEAVPFFGNGVLADLVGTAALFGGLDWVLRRLGWAATKPAAPLELV